VPCLLHTEPACRPTCCQDAKQHQPSPLLPAALQALRDGNLSFGFSAGGCLFPYYIGAAGALIDGGVLTGAGDAGGQGRPRRVGPAPAGA